eukprot:791905_1
MAFDFEDFIYKNKNEVVTTVKIRPTIQYSHNEQDKYKIDKCYYNYYFNDDPKNLYENYLHWTNSPRRGGHYWLPLDIYQNKYVEDSLQNRFCCIYANCSRYLTHRHHTIQPKYKPTYE